MADTLRSTQDFVGDVRTEMQKVTWPDRPQLKNSTLVIVVFVVVLSLIVFAMDFVSNGLVGLLTSVLG